MVSEGVAEVTLGARPTGGEEEAQVLTRESVQPQQTVIPKVASSMAGGSGNLRGLG